MKEKRNKFLKTRTVSNGYQTNRTHSNPRKHVSRTKQLFTEMKEIVVDASFINSLL